MALFSECMLKCARKLLDTADIVREAILRQLSAGIDTRHHRVNLMRVEAGTSPRMKRPCIVCNSFSSCSSKSLSLHPHKTASIDMLPPSYPRIELFAATGAPQVADPA